MNMNEKLWNEFLKTPQTKKEKETLGEAVVAIVEETKERLCLDEQKATGEQQETAFVQLVNDAVEQARKDGFSSIDLDVGGVKLTEVTGASKKEGRNLCKAEPYTDVIVHTNKKNWNLSMKGGSSPSVMGAGACGINTLYPNLLPTLAPKIIQVYKEEGYAEGKAWTANEKSMKRLAKKALAFTRIAPRKPQPEDPRAEDKYEKQRAFYGASVILRTIDSKGHTEEYPLFPDAPRGKEWGPNGLPSQWSASREFATSDAEGKPVIYITSNIPGKDATKAEIEGAKVKDIYFRIADQECIRKLFVGNEALGGPIDYLYKGASMSVSGELKSAEREQRPTLSIPDDKLLDVDSFLDSYSEDLYFRIRKRGFDSAFTVAKTKDGTGGIGGYRIFTTGRYTAERARIVVSFKPKSADAVLIGPEIKQC